MPIKIRSILLKPCGFPRCEASKNGDDGMKDYVLELARSQKDSNAKLNTMREYLQAYILKILHGQGFFRTNAFVGGTALRFLHGLPRFSEDLDFSKEKQPADSFEAFLKKLKRELELAGYEISISCRDQKTVQKASVKFEALLHEAGLSPLPGQKLAVKLEIDTHPPEGAGLKTEIVNKYFPIAFLSYDLPSLFAGKLTALFLRRYTKGRDLFDLGWYLSRWRGLVPNLALLRNGLEQASWRGPLPTESTWRDPVYGFVEKIDWERVREDVQNFLENPSDLDVFTKDNVLGLVKEKR